MTSDTSTAPERWTYDGTLDDMLLQYPWPGISAVDTRQSLDRQLICSVVTGTPILLNDGYLVFNPGCFASLRTPDSPLRILIKKGHLKVLARDTNQSLEGMVRHGAKQNQDMKNRKDILNRPDWPDIQRILNEVEQELRDSNAFVGWPRVDVSRTYWKVIQDLMELPADLLLQDGVPYLTFQKVVERFDNAMSKEATAARTKWEKIAKQVVEENGGTQDEIEGLMHLGNEVYHHNFGAALMARPPRELV